MPEAAVAMHFDEAGNAELFHVMGNGRGADGRAGAHLSTRNGGLTFSELLDDLIPARIGERSRNELNLFLGELCLRPGHRREYSDMTILSFPSEKAGARARPISVSEDRR